MKLHELLDDVQRARTKGSLDADVGGISIDSRRVRPGDLFVALRGTLVDGHQYVSDAVGRGAVVVVTDKPVALGGAVNVVVENTATALADIAARFFGEPARALFFCGITGTDGKTSTAHLYRSIVEASTWGKMGIIGTLGHGVGDDLVRTPHTTPDAVELHAQFRKMVDLGCRGVVMEVSSHAVRQHRTWGLDFDVGILTNVTHDHLDYHPTLEDYRAAKAEFCESLVGSERRKPAGRLVYWIDDPVAREIGGRFPGEKTSVGATEAADVVVANVEATLAGTRFEITIDDLGPLGISLQLLGRFSATNAALAAAAARATGIEPEAIVRGIESLPRVPGRFETLGGGDKPVVVIDYCHTPDAMERVLRTCRSLGADKLFAVFGCGGDRDRSKRPLMGRLGQTHTDFCFVTMDNPRGERVEDIVEDILSGMDRAAGDYAVELDRARAIRGALDLARVGDVVALLGKGEESSQIVGDARLPFSDREEAEGALASWPSSRK